MEKIMARSRMGRCVCLLRGGISAAKRPRAVWGMTRSMLGAAALAAPFAGSAEAKCEFMMQPFLIGSDTSATGSADSGKPCSLGIRNGRGTEFSNFGILQKPAHGRLGIYSYGYSAWVYQSNPGYHGQDHFVGTITGKSYTVGISGTTKVDVTLDVQ